MSASAPWHRQVARRRGSEGRAHQIRPVIQTGATVMDRLFGHGAQVRSHSVGHSPGRCGWFGRPEPVVAFACTIGMIGKTRKPMRTTKCVCAVMHIVKERVLTRARGERVPQEAAASEGFSASTVWVVGLAFAVRVWV
jgi:hypothetical protein